MPTWTFIEPTLLHGLGHQPAYLRAIRAALPPNMQARVVVPTLADASALREALGPDVELVQWPIRLPGDHPGNATSWWLRANRDLRGWFARLRQSSRPGDVAATVSTPMWLLAGFAAGARAQPPGVRTIAALYGFETPWSPPGGRVGASRRARVALTRSLVRGAVRRGSTVVAAQTDSLAESVAASFGIAVTPVPMLVHWRDQGPRASRRAEQLPRLTWLGQVREEKGFSRYLRLASALAGRLAPHGQFTVDNGMSPDELWRRLSPIRDLPDADIHVGHADDGTYATRLHEADLVALPYDRGSYWMRTSGVLVEALGYGAVLVVPSETWMAAFAGQHGGRVERGGPSEGVASGRGAARSWRAVGAIGRSGGRRSRAAQGGGRGGGDDAHTGGVKGAQPTGPPRWRKRRNLHV